jgi:hypothetical protein
VVEQTLLPDLLEDPPDALDIGVFQRVIRVLGVDPEGDPFGQSFPVLQVLVDTLAAEFVEPGDPQLLDVLLAADAQLFLYLELYGQPVGVPTRLAGDVAAA